MVMEAPRLGSKCRIGDRDRPLLRLLSGRLNMIGRLLPVTPAFSSGVKN
jgi:hypothetical protein